MLTLGILNAYDMRKNNTRQTITPSSSPETQQSICKLHATSKGGNREKSGQKHLSAE